MESRTDDIMAIQRIGYADFLKAFFGYSRETWDKLLENEEWFRNLWEANRGETEFWELYRTIKEELGEEPDYALFDRGWQYRNVLDPDYEQAMAEFHSLLFGWW